MRAPEVHRRTILFLLGLALAGCQGKAVRIVPQPVEPTGTSEMELLGPPERRERTPVDLDQIYPIDIQPFPRRQEKPQYPATGLPTSEACTARILFHVEVDGSVTPVRLEWEHPPDADFLKLFESSIRDAMAGWEYSPAHRIITTERPDGSIDSKAIPIKAADRVIIRFRVVDGRGVVE